MLQGKPAFKETEIWGEEEEEYRLVLRRRCEKRVVANNNMLIVLRTLKENWVDGARKIENFIIFITGHFWSDSFSLDFIKGCRYLLCFKILFQSCYLL